VAFIVFVIHFQRSFFEIKVQGFPPTLKLKAAFTSKTLGCPTFKLELVTSHNTLIT